MNTETIESIRTFKRTASTLRNLRPTYLEKIKDSSCDKHDMKFGGDDRFSVFKCTVFLDCHTGYYGNSSCSSLAGVDSAMASKLLNSALNKHMDLILNTMAEIADKHATTLAGKAEEELAALQALINSVKETPKQEV